MKGSIFNTLKSEGYIIPELDRYLISKAGYDIDRAFNVNAPSQMGGCIRRQYYSRIRLKSDESADPRSCRIFDMGTHVHLRLQNYLLDMGILLMDEVPVYNKKYNIQGHTDGIITLKDSELGILEIKSINSKGFSNLKSPKGNHITQGIAYIFCIERRRQELRRTYKNLLQFNLSENSRREKYSSLYQHLTDGHKYTREEKIKFQVDLHLKLDRILFQQEIPISKCIFLYECKDTQELKEFCISIDRYSEELSDMLETCEILNDCVERRVAPSRGCSSPKDFECRYCDYRIECWN